MSPIQTHGTDEIEGIVDADVDPAAGIQESKVAHVSVGGHDHDLVGTPTPAVLLVRQLRVRPSAVPDMQVQVAASPGVGYPDGITPAIAAQGFDLSNPLPTGGDGRIDLLYVDRAGVLQRRLGVAAASPAPPTHEGVYPIAEIGPILAGTTAITSGMIKDVRPFLNAGPLIRVKQGVTDLGFAHTLVAGTNVTAALVSGVVTLSASGGTGSPPNATTAAVGVVRVSANPPVGQDPVALAENDARVALIASAIQSDGSVTMTGDLNLGGNDLVNVGSLLFAGTGLIQAGPNANLNLTTTGTGKVRIVSPSALQLPSLTNPTTPNVGDIWYDPSIDAHVVRTTAGTKPLSTVQTGTIGLAVTEIIGHPTNPPTSGTVGDVPALDFPDDLAADHEIRFAFPVPNDALLVEDVKVRLVYCMSTAGSGNVLVGYDYTVVPVNGDLTPAAQTGGGTVTITPSTSAEVHQQNESIVIPFGQLSSGASVSVRVRRRSSDVADTRSGTWQLLYIEILYAKKDIASERNVVEVFDEVTSLGQFGGLKFRGNLIQAITESADVAIIDIADPNLQPATTTANGIVRISPAPAVASEPTAVGVNATFLPVQAEKDALAGTSGTPSGTNRYVTNADPRLPSTGENDALVGSFGTPSNTNRFVTSTDPRLPTQPESDALVGTAGAGPSTSNPYVLADFPNLPSAGEKAALGGSFGAPGASNPYLTKTDPTVILRDGTRAFTAPVPGVDPTAAAHLATKAYVDFVAGSLGGEYAGHVADLAALSAVPSAQRVDRQLRLVESEGAIYRFDLQGTGGGVPPNEGLGQWYKVQAATPSLVIQDEGIAVGVASIFNFAGGGVSATVSNGVVTVSVASGGGGGGSLDVMDGGSTIVAAATALNFNGTAFVVTEAPAGQANVSPVFSTASGTFCEGNDARLSNARTPLSHAASHQDGGGDELNVAGLSGRLADSQFVSIQDESVPQGQAHTFNVTGAIGTIVVASGVATLTLAPYGTAANTIAQGNDSRFPTSAEKAALAGTSGSPSNTNRYVTDADARNTNARTPTAHAASHQDGGTDEIDLTGLIGRSATSQFITIQDEGASQGQAHTLNVVGASGSIAVAGGIATLTLTGGGGGGSLNVKDGGTTVVAAATDLNFDGTAFAVTSGPAGQANVAPVFSTSAGTFCAGNDARLSDARTPTAHKVSHQNGGSDELDVAGLSGRLADSQFVTIQDEGVSQGQAHTLNIVGGSGSIAVASGVATLTLSGGGGGSVDVKKDNVVVVSGASAVDFTGFDVTQSPAGEANVSMPVATDARDGLMPTTAVIKLDSIEAGSQVNPTIQDEGVELGIATKILNFTGPHVTASFDSGTYKATVHVQFTGDVATTTQGYLRNSTASTPVHVRDTDGLTIQNDGATQAVNMKTTGTSELTFDGSVRVASNFTIQSLTATRVPFVGTGGLLVEDANFIYDTSVNTLLLDNLTATTTVKALNLVAGRVLFAGSGGLITDDAGMTYVSGTDTLTVGNIVASTTLKASNLTSGRVTFAGTGGLLTDDTDFTFAVDTLTVTKIATTQVTNSGLTSGRVVIAGASGLLTDDAALLYNAATDTLTTGSLTVSALTAGRVPYVDTGGVIATDAALLYNAATDTLSTGALNITSLAATRIPFIGSGGAVTTAAELLWTDASKLLQTKNFRADGGTITGAPAIVTGTFSTNAGGQLVDVQATPSSSTAGAVQVGVHGQVSTLNNLTGAVMYAGARGYGRVSNANAVDLNLDGTNFDADFPAGTLGLLGQGNQNGGSGYAVGGVFWAGGSTGSQFGSVSRAHNASGARAVGTVGYAGGATNKVGGWFTLSATDPSPAFSAGLVASNGAVVSASIARFLDDSTLVHEIKDGGDHDFFQHQALNFRLENLGTAPSAAAANAGRVLFRSDADKIQFDDGGTIRDVTFNSDHNVTSGKQGGTTNEYYHLTAAQHADLTDGGTATIHTHDHGALVGLGDDDHTIYPLASGARGFSGVVTGVTPTLSSHLATKGYVDSAVGSGGISLFHANTDVESEDDNPSNTGIIVSFTPKIDWVAGRRFRLRAYLFEITSSAGDVGNPAQAGTASLVHNNGLTATVLATITWTFTTSGSARFLEADVLCRSVGAGGQFLFDGKAHTDGGAPDIQRGFYTHNTTQATDQFWFWVFFAGTANSLRQIAMDNFTVEKMN